MMNRKRLILWIALVLCLASTPVASQSNDGPSTMLGAGYDLTWFTSDGGGGSSSGGVYTLDGTIGQPDAGMLSGGAYTLTGGFWSGTAAAGYRIYLPLVLKDMEV